MTLPSFRVGGPTTETVGFFDYDHRRFAEWLVDRLGPDSRLMDAHWQSIDDALHTLKPGQPARFWGCIGLDGWTLMLTDGPLGTDVGILPLRAADKLKCRAIRAVRVEDDEYIYPARVIEVFGPDGEPPLGIERSIVAANDGGRWVFETSGTPYAFEDQEAYKKRRKSHRFTGEMLHAYLLALGVPADSEPDWANALLVEDLNPGP